MSDVNPYAPPTADENAPAKAPRKGKKKRARPDVQAAIEALAEHLADPANVAADLKASGGRLRPLTLGCLGLGAAGLLLGAVTAATSTASRMDISSVLFLMFGGFLLVIGVVAMAIDLQLVSRSEASTPERTLKSYVRSLTLGRYGYAWASLCPTARGQSANAPDLGAVAAGIGSFAMDTEAGVKAYAGTFARVGNGRMRSLQAKNVRVARHDGDVAIVEADLLFQSWPQWASILIGLGGAFGWRIGGTTSAALGVLGLGAALVGFIAMLALRRRHDVRVRRTLLRGSNGVWYLFDPDVLEGAGTEE